MKAMTAIVLILLLSISSVESKDHNPISQNSITDELSIEAYDANAERRWMIELSMHLLQHQDINFNVMGLNHLNHSILHQAKHENDNENFNAELKLSILNRVLESQSITTSALLAARMMCQQADMAGRCDVENFNQQLFKQAPENINVYFTELSHAVQHSDTAMIDLILRQMSQAEYSQFMVPITVEFETEIDEYMNDHPWVDAFSKDFIEAEFRDLSESAVATLVKQSILQYYYIMNISNVPVLRPLMTACEQFQATATHCQSIASILMDHSDSMIMTTIGYDLNQKMSQIFGDAQSQMESERRYQEFVDYQSCLLKNHSLMDDPMYQFEEGFMAIMLQGAHEGRQMESAAWYLYQQLKDSGREGLVDPRNCGLRFIEPD
ncbi:hypothetical protein [Marinicella litoralis]|uniref:Secreted protein n=1 Tax=Marinicella litoralis TaxID=644220 RepID=A0A4R6XMC9_9GAMM|nr:hypothetical protein [Marinicella litoralis]TDR20746.1 hypothetical protein C8D91_1724 [Marinicella litoralis]